MYLLTHLLPVADTVFNLLDRIECLTTQPLVIAKSAQSRKVVGVSKLPNHLNGKGSNACPIILEFVLLIRLLRFTMLQCIATDDEGCFRIALCNVSSCTIRR